MLSPKQIGTICFAIFSFVFSAPSFADPDITSSASSANCRNDPLQTYTGTSNLQADWQPNTIALHWYNGDTEITSGVQTSCVYDGALTPPSTIPTKTGYTFKGWRVRQAAGCSFASSVCGLTPSQIDGLGLVYSPGWIAYEGSEASWANHSSDYGLTTPGTWAGTYSNGAVVRGLATCNNTKPDIWDEAQYLIDDDQSTEAHLLAYGTCDSGAFQPASAFNIGNTGAYCWCKLESYTPSGGSACNLSNSAWVLVYDFGSRCAKDCAWECAIEAADDSIMRRALFGVAQ